MTSFIFLAFCLQIMTSDKDLNCDDVKSILETKDLLHHFCLEKYDKPIVIVDTFNIMSFK